MEKVRRLIEAGASTPTAIKEALGRTLDTFAAENGLNVKELSAVINGRLRASDRIAAALAREFDATPYDVRLFLWEAGRPQPVEAP